MVVRPGVERGKNVFRIFVLVTNGDPRDWSVSSVAVNATKAEDVFLVLVGIRDVGEAVLDTRELVQDKVLPRG